MKITNKIRNFKKKSDLSIRPFKVQTIYKLKTIRNFKYPNYKDSTLRNVKTVQSYGYTTSDVDQLEEKIEFTTDELIKACRVRFSLSEKLCQLRVDHALEMADHELSYIDQNCEMEITVVRYLASNAEYLDEVPEGNDAVFYEY